MRVISFLCLLGLAVSTYGQSDQYIITTSGERINCTKIKRPEGFLATIVKATTTGGKKRKISESDITTMQIVEEKRLNLYQNLMIEDSSTKFQILLLETNDLQLYMAYKPVKPMSGSYGIASHLADRDNKVMRIYKEGKVFERIRGDTREEQIKKFFGECGLDLMNKSEKASWGGRIEEMAERYHSECANK